MSSRLSELESPEVGAFGALLVGAQRLMAAVEADLRTDSGMLLSELEVLIQLAGAPDQTLRPRELAHRCVMSTSGCTRLLDRLESRGLVDRRPHGNDRRGLEIGLTEQGAGHLAEVLPAHVASLQKHLTSALGSADLTRFRTMLEQLAEAHESCPDNS